MNFIFVCAHLLIRCFIAAQGRFVSSWKMDAPNILLVKNLNRFKVGKHVFAIKTSRTTPGCVCAISGAGDVHTLDSETLKPLAPAMTAEKGTVVQHVCTVDAATLAESATAFYLVMLVKIKDIFQARVIRVQKADNGSTFATTRIQSVHLNIPAEVSASRRQLISRATFHPKIGQLSVFWNGCVWAAYKFGRGRFQPSDVDTTTLPTLYCRPIPPASGATSSSEVSAKRRRKDPKHALESQVDQATVLSSAAYSNSGLVLAQLSSATAKDSDTAEATAKATAEKKKKKQKKKKKKKKAAKATAEATAEDSAEAAATARQVFQDADKNNNGFLTKSELRKYFKKHPAEKNRILGSDFQWKEFFTDMDKNGDNKFDVNEFTNFVIHSSKLAGTKKEEAAEPNDS